MDSKVVIEGEAPETDSEDELNSNQNETPTRMTKSIQGAAIAGEASESDDDDHINSISSAVSALTHPGLNTSPPDSPNDKENRKFNTLLHKKLSKYIIKMNVANETNKTVNNSFPCFSCKQERNRSLYNNIQTFKHNVINEAAKNLTTTDQQLLKSQVTLQSAITSLRSLNQHAANLKDRIDTIISSNFFSNVKLSSQHTDDTIEKI